MAEHTKGDNPDGIGDGYFCRIKLEGKYLMETGRKKEKNEMIYFSCVVDPNAFTNYKKTGEIGNSDK